MMRIDVVRDRCEGHGLCEERAPQVYTVDNEGYVVYAFGDEDVPVTEEAAAAAGARVCPVAALLVREHV